MDTPIRRRPPPASRVQALRLAASTQGIDKQLTNGGAWYLRSRWDSGKFHLRWVPLQPFHQVQSHG